MLASAHILSELLKVTLQAVGYVLDTRIFYFPRKTKCSSAPHILYELSFFLRDAGATKRWRQALATVVCWSFITLVNLLKKQHDF